LERLEPKVLSDAFMTVYCDCEGFL